VKIAVFVGSLRKDSLNKKLALNLEALAPEEAQFVYVDINLPLLNQDLESSLPQSVRNMKEIVEASDGVLFVTPEYNRGVPGVLKNAIDWASRPYNSFKGKPVGIVGATTGSLGTAVAQSSLRQIVGYLNMHLMGQPEVYFHFAEQKFDDNGDVAIDSRDRLQKYINAYVEHVHRLVR